MHDFTKSFHLESYLNAQVGAYILRVLIFLSIPFKYLNAYNRTDMIDTQLVTL